MLAITATEMKPTISFSTNLIEKKDCGEVFSAFIFPFLLVYYKVIFQCLYPWSTLKESRFS